jgi:hypothetical protein
MSAYMVSDETIAALVDVAVYGPAPDGWDWAGAPVPPDKANVLAQGLIAVNVLSLKARYPDAWPQMIRDSEPYEHLPAIARIGRRPNIVQALKLIAHWRYQSCEHDGWEHSSAAQVMRTLETRLIQQLPGYEEAPWGWERRQGAKA